jgi:hypothetical protein
VKYTDGSDRSPSNIRSLGRPRRYPACIAVIFLLLIIPLIGTVLKYNEVDDKLAPEDIAALQHVLGAEAELSQTPPPNESWPAQRSRIQRTVKLVFASTPLNKDIPEGLPREPTNVVRNGGGVCYDRSRLLEKALQYQGFQIRHVALYRKIPGKNTLGLLLTYRAKSHAVSEVLTSRGWLAIDSLDPWVALDEDLNPLSIEQLAARAEHQTKQNWSGKSSPFYDEPFLRVYGLYSRHGMFYPPFNRIPDVNYGQLLDNLR